VKRPSSVAAALVAVSDDDDRIAVDEHLVVPAAGRCRAEASMLATGVSEPSPTRTVKSRPRRSTTR
jgi:hypothetical protein